MSLPITLELSGSGGTKTFRTLDEVRTFIKQEWQDGYGWISSAISGASNINGLLNPLQQAWQQHSNILLGIQNNLNQNQIEPALSQFTSYFRGNPSLPLTESVIGQTIAHIRTDMGDRAAIGALSAHIGRRFDATDADQLRGFMAFDQVIAAAGKSARRSVQNALSSLLSRLSNQQAKAEKKADDLDDRIGRIDARRKSQLQRLMKVGNAALIEFTNSIQSDVARLKEQADGAIEEIRTVRMTFEEHMRLEAPVTYWRSKGTEHRRKAFVAMGIGIAYALILVLYALFIGFQQVVDLIETMMDRTHEWKTAYIVLALVIFVGTIAFWLGRLISRTYVSQAHLAIDAEERATMVQTYLALTRENSISSEERILVLKSLFRASADGLVKDDGIPEISLAGMVSKAGAGEKV